MSYITKGNASMTAGNLAVLKRSFVTTDDGSMRYSVDYCCLAQFAVKWTSFFRTRAQPPTPLPASMLQLQLTKTPELYDLTTETSNGLTYFRASYSAGVSSEVIITEESDVRNFTVTTSRRVGYSVTTPFSTNGSTSFVATGEESVTDSIDYVSVTVTAQSKNANLPNVRGRVEAIGTADTRFFFLPNAGGIAIPTSKVINRTSKTRSSLGEYTYSLSSSGVIESVTRTGADRTINP
jgi:hypothetical protein